jgi:hypothetical protein
LPKRESTFVIENCWPPAARLRADLIAINAQNARALKRRAGRKADAAIKTLVPDVRRRTKRSKLAGEENAWTFPSMPHLAKGVALWI